jgi:hypothetical protein
MADSAEKKTMRSLGKVLRSVVTVDDDMSPQMAEALLQLACQEETSGGPPAKDAETSHQTTPQGDVTNWQLTLVRP